MNGFNASIVLMVPPKHFAFNAQTAISNTYQKKVDFLDTKEQAMIEYIGMVELLRTKDIRVIELDQTKPLPDAVFPNNWFSTHINAHGKTDIILYPMFTDNRRQEVTPDLLIDCLTKNNIDIADIKDFRIKSTGALEGTGSVILDRLSNRLYASLSPRTDAMMVHRLAAELEYEPVIFNSVDKCHKPIYHTNVMMSLTRHYAIVCLESVTEPNECRHIMQSIKASGKEIIDITYSQLNHMCANVLELKNSQGDYFLIMSKQAFNHFTDDQIKIFERHAEILPVDLSTIETVGGGSARCMMAEIFNNQEYSINNLSQS